jgi:hypothetical protein
VVSLLLINIDTKLAWHRGVRAPSGHREDLPKFEPMHSPIQTPFAPDTIAYVHSSRSLRSQNLGEPRGSQGIRMRFVNSPTSSIVIDSIVIQHRQITLARSPNRYSIRKIYNSYSTYDINVQALFENRC